MMAFRPDYIRGYLCNNPRRFGFDAVVHNPENSSYTVYAYGQQVQVTEAALFDAYDPADLLDTILNELEQTQG